MTKVIDNGSKSTTTFTYDPAKGTIVAGGPSAATAGTGNVYIDPSGGTYTQQQIDASIAANPQASTGAYGVTAAGTVGAPIDAAGGGTGGGTTAAPFVPPDVASFLGIYGLPTDVINKVDQIFSSTSDVNQATALALSYIRGTTWYGQTYPGIQEGIAKGLVSNEADYRSYVNDLNQLTQQYLGRQIGSDEVANYLKAGQNAGTVGKLYQGQAYVKANLPQLQYVSGAFGDGRLSDSDLTSLGNENAGIDTAIGQKLQYQMQQAQQKLSRIFTGTLGTPSMALGSGGLTAPSLAGTKATPDVAA